MLPILSPQNTSSSLLDLLTPILSNISATYPGEFSVMLGNVTTYDTFYDWWVPSNGPNNAGVENLVGSRLLGEEALTDVLAVEAALEGILSQSGEGSALGLQLCLLGGKDLGNVVPRGGSDAVNPAWRKALVHASRSPFHSPPVLLLPKNNLSHLDTKDN